MSEITPHSDENKPGDGEFAQPSVRVKIIGVGGAGVNTIGQLRVDDFPNVQRVAMDTDARALLQSPIGEKIPLGRSAVTYGLSTGGDAEKGRAAAEADRESITRAVADAELVLLVAGLGSGTGSGVAPVVADIAAQNGAMVIAFVPMPFAMEGGARTKQAHATLDELRARCEIVIPLYNDLLMQIVETDEKALDTFVQANLWVNLGVRALCTMLFKKGLINVDLATLRGAFPARGGRALFSVGAGDGPDALSRALEEVLNSPLLSTRETLRQAETLLVNIMSGPSLTLFKAREIVGQIAAKFGGRENTVFSPFIDESYGDRIEICVIGSAGGFMRQQASPRVLPGDAVEKTDDAPEPKPSPSGKVMTIGDAVDKIVSSTRKKASPAAKPDQVEIDFKEQEQRSSFFSETTQTILDGQNIDDPTYFRRGIKIKL